MKRVFLVVIDALGVGALPDFAQYGDAPGANTLGSIALQVSPELLQLPTLLQLGLGQLVPGTPLSATDLARADMIGWYGRMAERSVGKDTTTGHWEMMGTVLDTPFPTYPQGFPQALVQAFIHQTQCGNILGNKPASGTAILEELGSEHLATGFPIVYTSADSVWQIAAHVDKVPLDTLYAWCTTARQLLRGPHEVSRVIARPFEGQPGQFRRLGAKRKDYAVMPPDDTALTRLVQAGKTVLGLGKIEDIFCGAGITHRLHTRDNAHGLSLLLQAANGQLDWAAAAQLQSATSDAEAEVYPNPNRNDALVFINLVETDMNFGHRRDVTGYAQALTAIDQGLTELLPLLGPDDLLLITADHGCDPTAPGSDHTREYVPLLVYSPRLIPGGPLPQDRTTFADVGQTVLDWLGVDGRGLPGESVLHTVAATLR